MCGRSRHRTILWISFACAEHALNSCCFAENHVRVPVDSFMYGVFGGVAGVDDGMHSVDFGAPRSGLR